MTPNAQEHFGVCEYEHVAVLQKQLWWLEGKLHSHLNQLKPHVIQSYRQQRRALRWVLELLKEHHPDTYTAGGGQ